MITYKCKIKYIDTGEEVNCKGEHCKEECPHYKEYDDKNDSIEEKNEQKKEIDGNYDSIEEKNEQKQEIDRNYDSIEEKNEQKQEIDGNYDSIEEKDEQKQEIDGNYDSIEEKNEQKKEIFTEKTSEIYWCKECNVPLYQKKCSLCGNKGKKLCSDIRPVFPEERLLLEIILEKPFAYVKSSVWNSSGNHYYVDGKRLPFSLKELKKKDTVKIREAYLKLKENNSYEYFEKNIETFVNANIGRYNKIVEDATKYIRNCVKDVDVREMFVSFSGGKDSTVTADLVTRALSNPKILHIFGDTTLEFDPYTYDYVERFKKAHPKTPLMTAKNTDHKNNNGEKDKAGNKDEKFRELCQQIGPPSRVMRWCCTIFKTGAIQKKIKRLFIGKKRILTFYGIRRSESASRSKYDKEADSPKITKQRIVSPIIEWMDFDVWLYILTTGIDFNEAYRLGYSRVGCWCCPNNSGWSEFLAKIHMPEKAEEWRNLLIEFASSIGKKDPEVYVDEGKWKARQGGNGVAYAQKSIVAFQPCATEENAFNYELQKPITEELYELFKPFGYLNFNMGNARLGEVYVLNKKEEVLLKLQGRIGSKNLKVTIVKHTIAKAKDLKAAEERIKCQLTKYQMCMGCLACESVCRHNALSVKEQEDGSISYQISEEKCVRCTECVNHFTAGCYMRKVLAIKRNK